MEKSKRILFVVTQADWGGAQTFIWNAAQEAMRRGFEVLLAYGGEGALTARCAEAGVPSHQLKKMKRAISLVHDIGAIYELATLMRAWKPDVVLLNSSKAGVVGAIAARLAGVPRVIYRIGGWSFNDPVSPLQKSVRLWMERVTAPLKDVIITNTPDGVHQARALGIRPRKRLALVPNGMNVMDFDATLRTREDARGVLGGICAGPVDAQTPIVLTLANFYPTKGIPVLLNALAELVKTMPTVQAVVLGDGADRSALEAQIQALNLTHHVALPGQRADASTLLRGADVFVLPSVKEGFPWALLEAMTAAVPCVATDVGGVSWIAEHAPWVVPPNNAHALANAMRASLADMPAARIQAARARRHVEEQFTDAHMWQALFDALEPKITSTLGNAPSRMR
jgi:glycosyltransferase involved in cell wall biosynthesis